MGLPLTLTPADVAFGAALTFGGAGLLWALSARRRRLAAGAALVLAAATFAWAAPGIAQTAGALVDAVQARVEAERPNAQALFDQVQGRERSHAAAARALVAQAGSPAVLRRGFSHLESTDVRGGDALADLGEGPPQQGVVYVAVSFSMPPADLRRLARDAHEAGAVVVIRGLVRGSFQETLRAVRQVFDEASLGGVMIDPNVFRAFDIRAVPTFIAAASPVEPCGPGVDCVPVAPAHDRVSGNISLGEALRRLEGEGQVGVPAAAAASARLED